MDNKERDIFVSSKMNEGVSISDIQKLLVSEFDINMTYMNLKLLISELEEIDWEKADPKPKPLDEDDDDTEAVEADEITSGTVIEISKIVRPGAMMSGSVKFESGAKAEWVLDNAGRLGLTPEGDSKPSQEDITAFQEELQRQLQSQ